MGHAVLTVRPSELGDFDEWFALFGDVAAEGRWIGAEAPVDTRWAKPMFERNIGSDSSVRFVALVDGHVVGDLGVTLEGGRAELGMMVKDGHRRQGIGSALLDACIDWSRAHGAHKVILSVWPHNDAAQALYRKYGFAEEGRLVRHYRRRNGELWDAIVMGLPLDAS